MSGALVWRAILAGAGFIVALSLLMSFGSGFLFRMVSLDQFAMLAFGLRVVSALADIGGGAIAGYIARRDGPWHGGIASLVATVVMVPVSLLRMWWISREADFNLDAGYWIDFGLWTVVGLVLAAVAGFLAAEFRKNQAG